MKLFTILLAAFLFLPAVHADTPIRLGVIQSLSGASKEDGENILHAIQLAADEINSSKTPKIELYTEDDAGLPAGAQAAFEKLKGFKVDLIIGPSSAAAANAISPLAARDKTAVLTTSNPPQALKLKESENNLFTNSLPYSREIDPFRIFMNRVSSKKTAIIREDSESGVIQQRLYSEAATSAGFEIVEQAAAVKFDDKSIREILSRIKGKGPQVVVLLLDRKHVEKVLVQAAELKYRVPFFGTSEAYDAFRVSSRKELYEYLCLGYPYKQLQSAGEFFSRFMRRFGTAPRIYANNSYDAVFMAWLAAKVARTKKVTVSSVLQELQYEGIAGKYIWSVENSFAAGQSSLVCIMNGYPAVTD